MVAPGSGPVCQFQRRIPLETVVRVLGTLLDRITELLPWGSNATLRAFRSLSIANVFGMRRPMPTVFENEIFPSVWEHALRTAASASDDAAEAAALERGAATFADWRSGLSPSYEAVTETSTVIADLLRLSSLTEAELMLDLQAVRGGWRCRLHHRGGQIELSTIVPILQDLGAVVTEHRPFALLSRTVGGCWIHDLGLRLDGVASPHPSDPDRTSRFEEAFIAAFSGRAESDRLASLVMRAGLSWREVTVLRAYRRYQRQIGTAFTDRHVHEVLERHPIAVAGLIEFFLCSVGAGRGPRRGLVCRSRGTPRDVLRSGVES